jgi:hypothetical protein
MRVLASMSSVFKRVSIPRLASVSKPKANFGRSVHMML